MLIRKRKALNVMNLSNDQAGLALVFGVLFIAAALGLFGFIAYRINIRQTSSLSSLTKTYDNGWYDYSFQYYEDASVTSEYGGHMHVGAVEISKNGWQTTSDPSCSLGVAIGQMESPKGSSEDVNSNGLNWRIDRFTLHKDQFFYETSQVRWEVQKDELLYSFTASQPHEQWCIGIVKTFKFLADDTAPEVISARDAKKAALVYASQKYPSRIFAGGTFIKDISSIKKHIKTSSTDAALVFLGEINTNETYNSLPVLKLRKNNSSWQVVDDFTGRDVLTGT